MIYSVPVFLILVIYTNAAPIEAEMEAHGALQFPDMSSTIPMKHKKDANPRDVPSFTSGLLSHTYPLYLRERQSKRDSELPTSWHLGKRAPWTLEGSSWAANMFKPSPTNNAQDKRSLSAWMTTSPWANSNKISAGKRTPFPNDWLSGANNANTMTVDSPNDFIKRSPYPISIENPDDQTANDTSEVRNIYVYSCIK